MKRNFVGLAAGLLFGLGLCLSGMYNPEKVLGFLDLAGEWDPSLAFVMAGAIAVAAPAFWLARRRRLAFDGAVIELPPTQPINARLVVGALVFGAGWGLCGVCPGPGLLDLGFLSAGAAMFIVAMTLGVWAVRALDSGLRGGQPATQDA